MRLLAFKGKGKHRFMTEDTPGGRLIGGAKAFLRAAELLHKDDPEGLTWAISFVNIAFAIELGLKSYLRQTGGSEEEQKSLRHDLVKAYRVAVARGFMPTDTRQPILVEELNPHHKDMTLRYLVGIGLSLPPLSDVIPVTRLFLHALHVQANLNRLN